MNRLCAHQQRTPICAKWKKKNVVYHSIISSGAHSFVSRNAHSNTSNSCIAPVSERLMRWTRNPLGSARGGSNPLGVVIRKLRKPLRDACFPRFNASAWSTMLPHSHVVRSCGNCCAKTHVDFAPRVAHGCAERHLPPIPPATLDF